MANAAASAVVALLVCTILVCVLVEDMRHFRIRNVAVVALTLCVPLEGLLRDRLNLLLPHVIFALAGFAVLALAFVLGVVGGGDAKLLAAALFWVGPEGCFVFALALLGCTICYVAGAWCRLLPFRTIQGRTVIPFGPSVAVAWMAHIGLAAWIS